MHRRRTLHCGVCRGRISPRSQYPTHFEGESRSDHDALLHDLLPDRSQLLFRAIARSASREARRRQGAARSFFLFSPTHRIVSLSMGLDPRCASRLAFLRSSSAHHYLPIFGIPEIDPRSRVDLFIDRFCAGRAPKDPRPPSHGGHDGSHAHGRFAKRFFLR